MIRTERLTFAYENEDEGKKQVIRGIDLEIEKGSFTAVLGRNGSGKSTLAKHFNALLLPSGGCVYVGGIDTKDDTKLYDIRRKAGMVFQNPDNQIVATTVEEDVAFGLENIGMECSEMHERVKWALDAVGMSKFAKSKPHLLSGGQKQRVAIAGVIAMAPECIVFDEPTAMLDPQGRKEVIATIKELNKKHEITVVLITHYMEEAAKADRVVVMDKGEIVMDGTPREVFSDVEMVRGFGLDVPQVAMLVHKLRKKGIELDSGILRTQECAEAIIALLDEGQN